MVQASEIGDWQSLETWFFDQPREVVIRLATRAVLRALPGWLDFCSSDAAMLGDVSKSPNVFSITNLMDDHRITPMPVLRAMLAAELFARQPDRPHPDAYVAAREASRDGDRVSEWLGHEARRIAYSAARAAELANVAMRDQGGLIDTSRDAIEFANPYEDRKRAKFWEFIRQDAEAIEVGENVLANGLGLLDDGITNDWSDTSSSWDKPNSPYLFWLRWYESLLDPENNPPINPDLLREIVLIDEEKWTGENAPELIAAEIERLERAHELGAQLQAAREEIKSLRAGVASPAMRASNYPDNVTPLEVLDADLDQADQGLRQAQDELEKPHANSQVLIRAAKAIGEAARVIARYVGKKADTVVDTALEEGTRQAVKWGVGVGGIALADHLLGISKALVEFAKAYPFP